MISKERPLRTPRVGRSLSEVQSSAANVGKYACGLSSIVGSAAELVIGNGEGTAMESRLIPRARWPRAPP